MAMVCGTVLTYAGSHFETWQIIKTEPWLITKSVVSPLLILPIVSLAAQLPLWPSRAYFGWRLEAEGEREITLNRQALSIFDILSRTAVVAVSLGLVRALPGGSEDSYIWPMVTSATFSAVVVSTLLLLPAVCLILRMKELAAGIGRYLGYVFAMAIVLIGVFSGLGAPLAAIFPTLWGCFVFAMTLAAPLFVWRACGYRLVWPRDGKR